MVFGLGEVGPHVATLIEWPASDGEVIGNRLESASAIDLGDNRNSPAAT